MVQQQLKAGEHTYKRKGDLATVKWRDRHVENKIKPTTVAQYSKHMSGVDHSDQLYHIFHFHVARESGRTKYFITF